MRRIAHISDLHFGTEDPAVAGGLLADLARQSPDLVVVSGDLTQRARRSQFVAAHRYLGQIQAAEIVVPGNHDLPLYNVIARFGFPLYGFRRFITTDLQPFYSDAEIAVAGVNTARSGTWKEGRISAAQINVLRSQFESVPKHLCKILVAHHPFVPPQQLSVSLVAGAKPALQMLEECGCSLILAGHLHMAYSSDARPHHVEITRSILVAQAGTAISRRRRKEPNAYNEIVIDGDRLTLEVRTWNGIQFLPAASTTFEQREEGWVAKLH